MSPQKDTPPKYLIQILVDHASPEAFFGYVDKGIAPHISKYILGEKSQDGTYTNATISRNIVTGYPSTSANSHTSIITGSYARKNTLLYTTYWTFTNKTPEYVDTEKISLSGLKDMNKKHINPLCKTLFEYMEDSASFHALNRGATYKLLTTKSILFKFLPLLLKIKRTHASDGVDPYAVPEFWMELFMQNISSFLKRIQKKGKFPTATFLVYLYTDEVGHKYGFDSKEYQVAMELLDYLVKSIVEGLKDKKGKFVTGLKEMGILDSVIWNICTDHAARRVYRDRFVLINSVMKLDLGLNFIDGDNEDIQEELKKLQNNYSKVTAFTMVGGELWHCWFGGPEGKVTSDFRQFYEEQFFHKILPNLNNKSEPVDLIKYLLGKEYVQFIIIPEDTSNFDGYLKIRPEKHIEMLIPREYTIKILSKEGIGQIKRIEKDKIIHYAYEVLEGKDPLDYANIGIKYGEFQDQQKWLENTINHTLPDVPHRLFGFFDCVHAPNFIVTSAYEDHFLSTYKLARKKEKLLKDYQTHDGLFREESVVPLIIAGPGIKKGVEIKLGRNIDILPTLLRALNIEFDDTKIDGVVLKEALE